MRRVDRRLATEVQQADAWTREEVGALLATAREHEPRLAPLLLFLLSTGCRRGEALGLKWEDVDFSRCRIAIRRAISSGAITTPKSGKGRLVAMPPTLASALFDLLVERRAEVVRRGWREVPEWTFCSEAGTALDERNLERAWFRVRRRAQKLGIRPLKLHCTRHTYASMALASGKSVKWTAEQLGHSSPMLTLKTYAHVMREEEADLSFADFDSPGRPYTAPLDSASVETKKPDATSVRRASGIVVELGGIEPPTPRLPALCSPS
jgi:integrase